MQINVLWGRPPFGSVPLPVRNLHTPSHTNLTVLNACTVTMSSFMKCAYPSSTNLTVINAAQLLFIRLWNLHTPLSPTKLTVINAA